MNYWKVIFYTLSVIPLGFIISLYAFYFKARQLLGYFPAYNNPDPKTLNIYDDYSSIIHFTFGLWFLSFIIWLLLMIIYIILKRKETDGKLIVISVFVHLCAIMLMLSGIFAWFVD